MLPTVFIHGAGGSAKHWLPLAAEFQGESMFFYELPGHGDRRDNVAKNVSMAATDFADFIEKHKLNKFNLIAHSLGGLVAMQYAITFFNHVSKLVLISTAAKMLIHPEFIRQIYSQVFDFEFLLSGFSGDITDDSKQQIIDDFSRLTFSEKSDDFMEITQCNLSNHLDKLTMPTLVLIGESDRIISPRRSRELGKKIPAAQLVVIPNAAHYPHLENVEATAGAIHEFIRNPYETSLFV